MVSCRQLSFWAGNGDLRSWVIVCQCLPLKYRHMLKSASLRRVKKYAPAELQLERQEYNIPKYQYHYLFFHNSLTLNCRKNSCFFP